MLEVTWGSHWASPRPELGIVIFGYVVTEDALVQTERELGADLDEAEMTLRNIRRRLAQGYVYGRCYSVACPEGEYGSNPIARLVPITADQFEQARVCNWDPTVMTQQCPWFITMLIKHAKDKNTP